MRAMQDHPGARFRASSSCVLLLGRLPFCIRSSREMPPRSDHVLKQRVLLLLDLRWNNVSEGRLLAVRLLAFNQVD